MTYVKVAVILTNLVILSISLYWTISSWLFLTPHKPFLQRTCTILTKQLPHNRLYYRNEFEVTLYTLATDPLPKQPAVAFRYGSAIYNQTLAQANNFFERFEERHNYSCWISPPGDTDPWEYQISLTIPNTAPSTKQRDMALISTIFTAMAFIAAIFQIFCLNVKLAIANVQQQHPVQPPTAGLETSRIESVCMECNDTDIECAICLEESDAPVAKLPCGHLFHMLCVKRWLVRGGRCPLCNWDLSEDHDIDNIPIVDEIERRTSTGLTEVVTDVVRNTSWRRLMDRGSCDDAKTVDDEETVDDGAGASTSAAASASANGSASTDVGCDEACDEACDNVSQSLLPVNGEAIGLRRRKSAPKAGDGGESSKRRDDVDDNIDDRHGC